VPAACVKGKVRAPHPFTGSKAPLSSKVKWVRFRDVANTGTLEDMTISEKFFEVFLMKNKIPHNNKKMLG